ncbi:ATP-dependent helicase [Rosistilla oblonga]|uniref:ATP-dependent helicase n=1 Tax=Rosistilla oblonga TaxID=2527990 RepID=UPI003A981370
MDLILDNLTDPQRAAVTHMDGPMLMLAGPGSGKTRVVTHRIAHLLREGVPASQILALTFTNKAAEEMLARVQQLAPGEPVWMSTFHRFCARMLRQYSSLVGLQENYSIYDMADAKATMKRAIEVSGISLSHTSPDQIANAISHFKNQLLTPESMEGVNLPAGKMLAAKVYPYYQQLLLVANAVDFDCMLLHVARMLRENPELREALDSRFRYIMVDEYQDTNLAQYAIVRSLSVVHQNLAVTGDPDQSIYGWRGANLNNILDFENDYPQVKTVRLEQNYRSTPNILRVADQLITNNTRRKHKGLYTHNPEGAAVRLRIYANGYQEADDIADQIVEQIQNHGRSPKDFAILCRMNYLTRSLEHSLRSRVVPYTIVRGVEFYQRKEIKDLLSYLQLINNPANDAALSRIVNTPARGIGKTTMDRVMLFAARHRIPLFEAICRCDEIESIKPRTRGLLKRFVGIIDALSRKASSSLEDLLRFVLEQTQYSDYLRFSTVEGEDNDALANVDELVSAAVEFDRQHPDDGSLETFLEQVALISDTDAWEESSDRVTLMTLHAAKGLEFPCVYIIGVEDQVLPHHRSHDDPMQFEEERRLLFVGITRAEQTLQLSMAKLRSARGSMRPAAASPFLLELPREEMQVIDAHQPTQYGDDNDFDVDVEYPEAWDMHADHDDDLNQLPPEERTPETTSTPRTAPIASVTTAAQMLEQQMANTIDPDIYTVGMIVSHPEYGSGRIQSLSGSGGKRTATVNFFVDSIERRFRLSHAQLTIESED